MTDNVFSPAFGNRPKTLVGRETELQTLYSGLSSNPGTKERVRLIVGQRGLGKTVLLLEVASYAKEHGYLVASPTVVSQDMKERILEKLLVDGQSIFPKGRRKLTGGSLGLFGISIGIETEKALATTPSFSFRLSEICDAAQRHSKGILILIDEVQNNESMRDIAIAYQELVGAGKNIALIMAGLPASVSNLLNDHVLTFLNRASKLELEPVRIADVDAYYYKCFRELKIKLSESQILEAAVQSEGSPYLMQLIGHYIVLLAEDDGAFDEGLFQKALLTAKKEYMNDLCSTALHGLSKKDISFLKAMVQDNGASRMKQIAERMNVAPSYAQTYKKRLLTSGVIEQPASGEVRFAVPMLREYLIQTSDI